MPVQAPVKTQAITRVVDEIRRMIAAGELLPGQEIRQESMAKRLGVSRLPVREGLRQLTADGLVKHTPNVGYMVARLSRTEFDEIYVMRRLLETELISRLPRATDDQLEEIIRLNDLVIESAGLADLAQMRIRNQAFHFEIFNLSELKLVIAEIERYWTWASPYHAVHLFSPESRQEVLDEHQTMIEAVRTGDNALLNRTMDLHRHGTETQIGMMLGVGAFPIPIS